MPEEYTCPNCGNPIYDEETLLCLYCGNSLRRKIGFMGKMKHAVPVIFLILAIGIIIVLFTVLTMK